LNIWTFRFAKGGMKITRDRIPDDVLNGVISQLKKDGLVISKRRVGSFVA
jgi:DNA-binding IscR family transcriptional regulator